MDTRPTITYATDQISVNDVAIDIAIDTPFNGFFGTRLLVPTPEGTKDERDARIVQWVKEKVGEQVGRAIETCTIRAL